MNIYRAKRVNTKNGEFDGNYIQGQLFKAGKYAFIIWEYDCKPLNYFEIDTSTIEVIKLDFNATQQKKLIYSAKKLLCNDDLHDYLWNIQYYAKYMIQENKLNQEFIDEAIEQIDWILEVFKEVNELLEGIY